ncbi:MAG: hypothetical protein ABIO78_07095 [Thermoanaerobaculia bacterium]
MLIRASAPMLRQWLGAARLDQSLIGTLYLRQRSILENWYATVAGDNHSHEQLVEQLAVAIYLTAAAWQTGSQPDVRLLSSLREIVAARLRAPETIAVGAEGPA